VKWRDLKVGDMIKLWYQPTHFYSLLLNPRL